MYHQNKNADNITCTLEPKWSQMDCHMGCDIIVFNHVHHWIGKGLKTLCATGLRKDWKHCVPLDWEKIENIVCHWIGNGLKLVCATDLVQDEKHYAHWNHWVWSASQTGQQSHVLTVKGRMKGKPCPWHGQIWWYRMTSYPRGRGGVETCADMYNCLWGGLEACRDLRRDVQLFVVKACGDLRKNVQLFAGRTRGLQRLVQRCTTVCGEV